MAFNETFTLAIYFDKELKAFSITSTDLTMYTIRDNMSLSVTICYYV